MILTGISSNHSRCQNTLCIWMLLTKFDSLQDISYSLTVNQVEYNLKLLFPASKFQRQAERSR